eukprot:3206798-Pleurochrysis_carterae.AAC.1
MPRRMLQPCARFRCCKRTAPSLLAVNVFFDAIAVAIPHMLAKLSHRPLVLLHWHLHWRADFAANPICACDDGCTGATLARICRTRCGQTHQI